MCFWAIEFTLTLLRMELDQGLPKPSAPVLDLDYCVFHSKNLQLLRRDTGLTKPGQCRQIFPQKACQGLSR